MQGGAREEYIENAYDIESKLGMGGVSVTPAPRKLRQKDLKCQANLDYIVRPCLKGQ